MKNPEQTVLFFREKLKESGIRLTHQRLEIIREVVSYKGHPSVSDVYEALRSRMPTLSLDTVYRTMKKLSEMSLINPVGYSKDGARFDADRTPHHHFLCSICGEAYDFRCPSLDAIEIPEEVKIMGRVKSSRMEFRGICNDCMEKEGGVI